MHERPATGAGTEPGLASSIAASAVLARGIRPPLSPSSSSAAQTASTSRGREAGRSPPGREAACPAPGRAGEPRGARAPLRAAPAGAQRCRGGSEAWYSEAGSRAVLRSLQTAMT
ncbi:uncharacterized protein LOC116780911 isoform X3 [Chiroxiphia lanceolata]|uniref:uncharacterized protein LOC116780911 isoform X3 n=1 Tax=Chiroxiphia lanceolata TaxID=296741 RepID=UPI0013CE5030|nr:uncharacterized protein LOC116780911 isoform X3 [Chiroxiphia lanceolata]